MLDRVFSADAIDDLENIHNYTSENWSFEQADAYLDKIDQAVDRLRKAPYLAPVNHQLIRTDVRFLLCGSHWIVYRVTNRIEIIRILHTRQNYMAILDKI